MPDGLTREWVVSYQNNTGADASANLKDLLAQAGTYVPGSLTLRSPLPAVTATTRSPRRAGARCTRCTTTSRAESGTCSALPSRPVLAPDWGGPAASTVSPVAGTPLGTGPSYPVGKEEGDPALMLRRHWRPGDGRSLPAGLARS